MSEPNGPAIEQGRRLLGWLEKNRTRLALALGAVWALGAAATFRATRATEQQQQADLARLLAEQEEAARQQRQQEVRWQQEEKLLSDVRRDEEADWGKGRR